MSYSREKSQPIFDRALNVLVKGVSSNFRYLGDKETPVIVKGKGAQVWDADNNEFVEKDKVIKWFGFSEVRET